MDDDSEEIFTNSPPQTSAGSSFNDDIQKLLDSPGEWKKQAIRYKLVGGSIFDLNKYASASKIGYKQFLCLRAVWIGNQANILANDDTRRTWLGDSHYSSTSRQGRRRARLSHRLSRGKQETRRLGRGGIECTE